MIVVSIHGYGKGNGNNLLDRLRKEIEERVSKDLYQIKLENLYNGHVIDGFGSESTYCNISVLMGETDQDFFTILDILKHEGFSDNIHFFYSQPAPHQKK
jgi:hypothetical protein